ncbi:uncharacterized protein IL334_001614 [Kwoniella shivajii]|uniref:Uncharacterized protein n=1 Tax=Kwoniella shivajii TaxID=564305 RepID=A0ABZ1CSS0_9TREE|nr:hypothetical protein IL334_001614 [Kwoniella shivajii]
MSDSHPHDNTDLTSRSSGNPSSGNHSEPPTGSVANVDSCGSGTPHKCPVCRHDCPSVPKSGDPSLWSTGAPPSALSHYNPLGSISRSVVSALDKLGSLRSSGNQSTEEIVSEVEDDSPPGQSGKAKKVEFRRRDATQPPED